MISNSNNMSKKYGLTNFDKKETIYVEVTYCLV